MVFHKNYKTFVMRVLGDCGLYKFFTRIKIFATIIGLIDSGCNTC
jgi:hypothetical protein